MANGNPFTESKITYEKEDDKTLRIVTSNIKKQTRTLKLLYEEKERIEKGLNDIALDVNKILAQRQAGLLAQQVEIDNLIAEAIKLGIS